MTRYEMFEKRAFDVSLAAIGLVLTSWLICISWLVMTIDTHENGLFTQIRIGQNGRHFKVYKIRTMRQDQSNRTTVTTACDKRITSLGRIIRGLKIDELPQLYNVLIGDMSFVGPRPDVPGYADNLSGDDAVILSVKPGITGPATIKYRHEEKLLASVSDPERYNREVIYPDKVAINREYVLKYSFLTDLKIIFLTLMR